MKKIILADQKLNQLVDDVTARLMAAHNFEADAIGGEAITQFCPHSQVNQFILFRIYQDWNAHISQMVHPYFDFTAYEVKEGLRRFLNILSGHILVKRQDFEPLVRQAVYNSLRLLLNAEESIGKFFFLNTESVGIEIYRKHAPYFSNFDFVIQAILKYHEKNELGQVEKKVFFEKFEKVIEIWEKKEGKSISEYQREEFKALTGKELEEVISTPREEAPKEAPVQESVAEVPQPVPPVVEESPKVEERKKPVIKIKPSDIQRPEEKKVEEVEEEMPPFEPKTSLPPWVEQKEDEPASVSEPEEPRHFAPSAKPPKTNLPPWVQQEVDETNVKSSNEELADEKKTIAKSLEENKPRSLNEMFADKEKKSIVDQSLESKPETPRIQVSMRTEPPKEEPKPKQQEGGMRPLVSREEEEAESRPEVRTIADQYRKVAEPQDEEGGKAIKPEQIPVHKQFQFVQKVFGGSSVKFKVVLDKINKTENLEEAVEVLDKYVFNDPNVNRNDKVSKEFESMVRARFES